MEFEIVTSMYTDYFGLAENPFRITPDPRILWYSRPASRGQRQNPLSPHRKRCPIYLLAHIGTGKTTLARRIVEELSVDKSKKVVFAFTPKLPTTNSFLRFVMDEFGGQNQPCL